MFENMVDLMLRTNTTFYVFDTTPTANARGLLGMSKVYSLWVNKMVKSREEARSLRELFSFTKKKEADPLMEYLVSFRDRMGKAQNCSPIRPYGVLLRNPRGGIAHRVITRFIGWFHEFGIPVGGVIVNMLIDRSSSRLPITRVCPQPRGYAGALYGRHLGEVRLAWCAPLIPLYETEIRGTNSSSHG